MEVWRRMKPLSWLLLILSASAQLQSSATLAGATQAATQTEANGASLHQNQLAANFHYLFLNSAPDQLKSRPNNETDPDRRTLNDVLGRIGPDMRPASGFEQYEDIGIEVAKLAWRSMRQHAQLVAGHRVDLAWPLVEWSLQEANVSSQCLAAAHGTALAAKQLKAWAIQLLNSWGSFPAAGVFEGTLGDVGSFHGCLNVAESAAIKHAHYCTLSYRPVLPARRHYDILLQREPQPLLELFEPDDAFHKLLSNTQYNHFVYYKLGTCFPIDCSPIDVQKFSRLLGRRAGLMSGPVKCHSGFARDYEDQHPELAGSKLSMSFKDLNRGIYIWKPHMSTSQLVALICLAGLLALILLLTLADLLLNRLPQMLKILGDEQQQQQQQQLRDSCHLANVPKPNAAHQFDPNNNHAHQPERAANSDAQQHPIASPAELTLLPPTQMQLDRKEKGAPPSRAKERRQREEKSFVAQLVHDCSLVTSVNDFLAISKPQLESEILCLNGLRCITMSWIILTHTIQYNDWSAFARIYDVEVQLWSWLNQPIFNASYLVDTFFLMSGLLTSFTVFKQKRAKRHPEAHSSPQTSFAQLWLSFSCKSYLVGRYLRLTPQIMLVSLLFILLPLSSSTSGPHWMAMTGEYSENCANNWWLNLFHIQAFYKSGEMCNFVCWWISVDMFYHLLALALVVFVLKLGRARLVLGSCSVLLLANALIQATRHYQMGLPPNLLSTIPQVGAMWSEMTLKYFWTPTAHLFPFLAGFYLGFLMAHRRQQVARWFTRRRLLVGWPAAIGGFMLVLFSTRWWVVGEAKYSPETSTAFNLLSQAVWSLCLSWTIVACHFGQANLIGRLLACRLFIVLGRASYMVYLSHFLVLFTFFGSQNLLLEPTRIMILYIILGNVCLSMLFGCLLCVVFELPWLKLQKRIMRHI